MLTMAVRTDDRWPESHATPDRVLRRGHGRTGRLWSLQFSVAFAWRGMSPFRTPGKKDKPLRYAGFGGRQRRKSPVRRCFKSRPPFGGVRRFASGCRFYAKG